LFVAIGNLPATTPFKDIIELDGEGFVLASEDCHTSKKGIFVAGDCRQKTVRQLTTAASDGSVAALAASEYVRGL
jgi:thioredoxin reductase (NADPH)